MLIKKPVQHQEEEKLSKLQEMALQFLPSEQVRKFAKFPHLIEAELMNEAREPEMENTIKDLFNALHEGNTPKLLKVLQGDKKKLFYAFKKQLESKPNLTKKEAKVLSLINEGELSLLSLSLIRI